MAWPFNSGDNKKRRRMGQMARTSWQARWEKFFSGREVSVSEVPPPSPGRIKRAAAISAYDEPDTGPSRGRSLPRWRRSAQVTLWKIGRPLRAIHRRIPAAILILIYLGLLGGLSVVLMLLVLPGNPPAATPPAETAAATTPTPSENPPERKLSFQPDPQAGKAARVLSLRTGSESAMSEQMADIEFRAGNYGEAEKLYRKLFPTSETKPLMGYRIFVCALIQENRAQADDLLPRLTRVGAETPAYLYAKATLAWKEGRPEEAAQLIAEAKTQFGEQCADYDGTLRLLGYAP
jgi:hypothetical protein